MRSTSAQLALFPFQPQPSRTQADIDRAVVHAEREIEGWPGKARKFLQRFMAGRTARFTAAEFRQWAEPRGLPEPPHQRAYGGVMQAAAREGAIVRCGYRMQSYDDRPHTNRQPVTEWRAAGAPT